MRRVRLGVVGAIVAGIAVIAATGVAPAATSPTATASQAPVAGSPSAIACGGYVDSQVTVTGHAGTTGRVDRRRCSCSTSRAAPARPRASSRTSRAPRPRRSTRSTPLTAPTDHAISGNAVGIVYYQGPSATLAAAARLLATRRLSAPISRAAGAVRAAARTTRHQRRSLTRRELDGYAKSMVLVTDGQADRHAESNAATAAAATKAKAGGTRIVPIGHRHRKRRERGRTSKTLGVAGVLLPVRHARPDRHDEADRRSRRRGLGAGDLHGHGDARARTSAASRAERRARAPSRPGRGTLVVDGHARRHRHAPRSSTARRATAANVFASRARS